MELRHLRYFVTLAESLHFTRAAERVHVTQSTLSHQIRKLEEELGQTLFDRIGKRVLLTDAGELFLGYALKALREVDQGVSELMRPQHALVGELRIGATHTFNMNVVPECLALFLRRYPHVKVTVRELSADDVGEGLLSGQLDLGIAYEPKDEDRLWFEPLYAEEMVLVVAHSHPFAQRRRVRMAELHRRPMVLLPKEFATRALLEEYFRAAGVEPVAAVEMNTIGAMIGLVARTELAAIVSTYAIGSSADVTIIPLESPRPVRTPGMLWKRGTKQSRLASSFASMVRKRILKQSLQTERSPSAPQERLPNPKHLGR